MTLKQTDNHFQAARALTILALMFQFFGVCIAIIGLDCTTVAMDQPRTKARAVSRLDFETKNISVLRF